MTRKWAAVAAALIAVGVLVAWNLSLSNRLSRAENQVSRKVARAICAESNKLREAVRGNTILALEAMGLNPNPPRNRTLPEDVRARSLRGGVDLAFRKLNCNRATGYDPVRGYVPLKAPSGECVPPRYDMPFGDQEVRHVNGTPCAGVLYP